MYKIAPSLLEADYRFLDAQLKTMENAGASYVHLDVMDGNFVPNLALGMREIQSIRPSVKMKFDVHMMVWRPERYIEQMKKAGADILIVHYEACRKIKEVIKQIKNMGMEAGIALKPETSLSVVSDDLLENLDVIHIMSVQPGVEKQTFITDSLKRIREMRNRIDQIGASCEVEVDGGVNMENVKDVVQAGATVIVAGKALFVGNLEDNIHQMKQLIGIC